MSRAPIMRSDSDPVDNPKEYWARLGTEVELFELEGLFFRRERPPHTASGLE